MPSSASLSTSVKVHCEHRILFKKRKNGVIPSESACEAAGEAAKNQNKSDFIE
jgi:hypothetical protein